MNRYIVAELFGEDPMEYVVLDRKQGLVVAYLAARRGAERLADDLNSPDPVDPAEPTESDLRQAA